jgi:putative DNA primase/helicase
MTHRAIPNTRPGTLVPVTHATAPAPAPGLPDFEPTEGERLLGFDPAEVARNAVPNAVPETEGPILNEGAPLDSARVMVAASYMRGTLRTIHHQQGGFHVWRSSHYAEVPAEEMRAAIYDFLDKAQKVVGKRVVPFNPTPSKTSAVLDALAAAVQLGSDIRPPAWLDDEHDDNRAEDFLACKNGLLHLPTRHMLPQTPAFFNANAVDYDYEPNANRPEAWLAFLASVWPDDPESIACLQELFGLLLTSDTSLQKAFLLIGPKRSGKGTVARVLTALLGKENVSGPTLSSLAQNFGLAPLIRSPLAIISDARLSGRVDAGVIVERLLAITGEDAITIDRKYKPAWTGRLPTRFMILTNELPRLSDASGAMASRLIVLQMRQSFLGREDAGLANRLMTELPGILTWALDGRDRLAKRGYFLQPKSGAETKEQLEDLASPISSFLRERCEIGAEHCVDTDVLYGAWVNWCTDNGRDHAGNKAVFGRDLRAALPEISTIQPRDTRTGERLRYYQGLRLVP